MGLTQQVNLVGSRPAREVFAQGRIAVVPSLAESLPYIVLEAAAARLPVISTRVGGIPEIFGPTAHSLVPASDVVALRSAMQRGMDNPEAAQAETQQRLAYISQHFAVEQMVSRIEALYFAALGRLKA